MPRRLPDLGVQEILDWRTGCPATSPDRLEQRRFLFLAGVRRPAEGGVRDDADDPSPLDDQDMDRAAHRLSMTIIGKEVEEDRKAVAEYGASDSGASLGDILGAAIRGGIRPPL